MSKYLLLFLLFNPIFLLGQEQLTKDSSNVGIKYIYKERKKNEDRSSNKV